jgi:hypothetical protein
MLIRAEQMAVLRSHAQNRANVVMADYARKRFPTLYADAPQQELLELAQEARTRAAEFGIHREDLIATWLDLMVMYGSEFHRNEWASGILGDFGSDPEVRFAVLTRLVERSGVRL